MRTAIIAAADAPPAHGRSGSAAPAPAPPIPPELADLAERMRTVRSLAARVYQEKEIAALAEVVRNEGRFAFARPRRLAMDLDGPGGTLLVLDGDTMTVRYKGLDRTETTRLSVDPRARAVAEHLFLLLDADPPALARVYRMEVLGRRPLEVRLTPLAEALSRIIGHVDAQLDPRGFVSTLVIVEANGDRTRWSFREPVINAPLPSDLFSPPPR